MPTEVFANETAHLNPISVCFALRAKDDPTHAASCEEHPIHELRVLDGETKAR
jgi:hypothetical protein